MMTMMRRGRVACDGRSQEKGGKKTKMVFSLYLCILWVTDEEKERLRFKWCLRPVCNYDSSTSSSNSLRFNMIIIIIN